MQTLNPAQVQTLASAPVPSSRLDEAQLRRTAEDFEATFLSQMLKPMFEGLQTDGPFGGGSAEETWRSFLIDAMARQTVRSGGVGLADRVMSEMLKMQEQAQ
ncbi:rod-binding protein [Brevundimonas vesicularis]|uniref:rod-binding protein n=1 Tax=Brevundimonas vesicularis TaxID=41276 RepID=UPI0038D3F446